MISRQRSGNSVILHRTTNKQPNTSCQSLHDTDVQIEIVKPAPVKDESETAKWDTGKASIEKAEIQQPDQPMVITESNRPTR